MTWLFLAKTRHDVIDCRNKYFTTAEKAVVFCAQIAERGYIASDGGYIYLTADINF